MLHQIDRHAARLLIKLQPYPLSKKFRENELADEFELSPHWLRFGRFRGYGPKYDRLPNGNINYTITNARSYLRKRAKLNEIQKNRSAA